MGAFLTCVVFFVMNVTGVTAYLERIGAEQGNKFAHVVWFQKR